MEEKAAVTTQKYLEDKIKEFERRHIYKSYLTNHSDKELARRWKEEQEHEFQKWRAIKSNTEVYRLIDVYNNVVTSIEKNKRSFIEDGFDMALALDNAIRGLRKMAQSIEPKTWSDSKFISVSNREVDEIFERLDKIAARMNAINCKRAMRD